MWTAEQVESIRQRLMAEGQPRPEIVRQIALACTGWPYVFGAWGEMCTPAGRKRRARTDHPTIVSKCPAINGGSCSESSCKWGIGVRMFDCRGFTRWCLQQAGLDIAGQGATSQYNTAANWVRKGKISEMPDCVCCLFRQKGSTMEHTGLHLGGGLVCDCSVNVRTGGLTGWTHYAIPVGLYEEGAIPVDIIRPTLRRGARGDLVLELQATLTELGYECGNLDGIFGTKTYNAVVAFQTDAQLDPDGVCGPKTWKALAAAEAQKPPAETAEPTYRVTCEGVTWEQYAKIREICPLAEAVKEKE